MKKLVLALLVGMLMIGVIASPGLAQEKKRTWQVGGIYYNPTNSHWSDIGAIYGLDAGLIFWIKPNIGIGPELQYLRQSGSVGYYDYTTSIVPIFCDVIYNFKPGEKFQPYAGGGLGFYSVSWTVDYSYLGYSYSDSSSDSGLALQLLGGVKYGYFFAEGHYMSVSNSEWDDNLDGIEIVVGAKF